MTLYGFLMREGRIASDWMARQVAQTDRTDGDIDTLSNRIAQVRTWTFAANRPDWLDDPGHWQGVARGVEDRLSDALHERLTQRFVDRRTSVLMRRLRENAALETEITKTGDLVVEGHVIGHLSGFEFAPADSSSEPDAKASAGSGAKGAGERNRSAREAAYGCSRRAVRARRRRHDPLDRRSRRAPDRGRQCAGAALAYPRRRAIDGPGARQRRGAAHALAEDPYREIVGAPGRARQGRGHYRHCARRRLPARRSARRLGAAKGRR